MSKLVFEMPTAQTPGYLKRMRSAMEYNRKINSREALDPEIVDDMVEFLLPYIIEPVDRDEARELMIEDLTQEQFGEMFDALSPPKEEEPNPTAAEIQSASLEPSEKVEKESSSQDGLV